MIKKTLLLFLLIFAVSFKHISADEGFKVDSEINYSVQTNGITNVINKITIENSKSELFSNSYVMSLSSIKPQNIVVLYNGVNIDHTESESDGSTTVKVDFPDKIVGKGEKRVFEISYSINDMAKKTGDVWEISIPKVDNTSFRNYQIVLSVPKSFGNEAYVTPDPLDRKETTDRITYLFNKDTAEDTPITAGFGKFQVFSFTLNYHLENSSRNHSKMEIALPPDTSTQKVYYQNINPAPENVYSDIDGNWLASFTLKPKQRIDVAVIGNVQIFSAPRNTFTTTEEQLQSNLNETLYWQKDAPNIKSLAEKYNSPEAIYNYVTENLEYDYTKVKNNPERLGALGALNSPDKAICMEFTDLFIATARAAGIPAREINGYAYTENAKIQPLSLVSDVLHSWPEYWDDTKKTWVPIDPTWGMTSGIDYFNKLDLRHFAFVIHGQDAVKPYSPGSYKLGPNPQKDVYVSFGDLPEKRTGEVEILARTEKKFPLKRTVVANVKNEGTSALYNLKTHIYFDDNLVKEVIAPVLPPYSSYTSESEIPFSFLSLTSPYNIKVIAQNKSVNIPSSKIEDRIIQLFIIFVILTGSVLLLLSKTGKIHLRS